MNPTTTHDPRTRRTAIVIGLLFLVATATFITGDALVVGALAGPVDVGRLRLGVALQAVDAVAVAALGIAFLPVLRPRSPGLALGHLVARVLECGVILALGAYMLTAQRPIDYEPVIYLFTGTAGLLYTTVLLRDRLVAPRLAWLGVVGYLAILAALPLGLFDLASLDTFPGMLLYVPGGLFEFVLPVVLLARGFRHEVTTESRVRDAAETASAPRAREFAMASSPAQSPTVLEPVGALHDAAPALPDRSLAAVRHEYGPPTGVEVVTLPVPTPGPGQVLLRVHAGGLDRGTWHLMAGQPYAIRLTGYGLRRPKQPRLGRDVAGTVIALGEGVDTFVVGDEVFGIADGSWAEHAVADVRRLALRPKNVSPVEAAVSAVSGIAALQALVDVAGIEAGQRVLVVGASGGVGSFAVQIAVALGARVDGVASAAKAGLVRDLGATDVYDYATDDPFDGLHRYDVIVDTGGNNRLRTLRRALTDRGTLVIVGGEDGGSITGLGRQMRAAMLAPFTQQRMPMFFSAEAKGHVVKLAALLEDGTVVPVVGATYGLADVRMAIEDLVAGRARGKSAILVAPSGADVH